LLREQVEEEVVGLHDVITTCASPSFERVTTRR
jgi:hypothetical protein